MTAKKLAERISALEVETAAAFEAIAEAEIALAKVISEGGNVDSAHARLAKARDIATGSVAALRRLDAEYFQVAAEESAASIEAYNTALSADWRKVGTAAEAALKSLEKVMVGIVPDPRAKMTELHAALLAIIWADLQASYGARYAEMTSPPPAAVVPRNDRGRRLTTQEINSSFTGGAIAFPVPGTQAPVHAASTFDWKAAN